MGSTPVNDLPPGFVLDDLPEGFTLDEPAPENPLTAYQEGGAEGVKKSLKALVNPVQWARGIKELGKLGIALATPPTVSQAGPEAVSAIARGLLEEGQSVIGMKGAREMGRAHGTLAVELLPALVAPVTRAATAARIPNLIGRSRLRNIAHAIEAKKGAIPELRRLESLGEIDLPIGFTRQGIRDKLALREAQLAPALEEAKASLSGRSLSAEEVANSIERPGRSYTDTIPASKERIQSSLVDANENPLFVERNIPERQVTRQVTGDEALDNAVMRERRAIRELADEEGNIPADRAQVYKEDVQADVARKKGYDKGVGEDPATSLEARARAAQAVKRALENVSPDLERSNLKVHATKTLLDPLNVALDTGITKPVTQRLTALGGRALAPAAMGAGGLMISPAGAIAGISIGVLQQSPIWQTFSAATKKALLHSWAKGNVANFERMAGTAIVESYKRQQQAEQALQDQGKGVVGP